MKVVFRLADIFLIFYSAAVRRKAHKVEPVAGGIILKPLVTNRTKNNGLIQLTIIP